MPSWPARLLSNNSFTNATFSTAPPSTSDNLPTKRRQETDCAEPGRYIEGVPTLHPSLYAAPPTSGTSPPRQTSRHGRSISHPFPSLFGGTKKTAATDDAGLGFDSTDDELIAAGHGPPYTSPSKGGQNKPQKPTDKDFTTGRCMTCDSLVRFPKDLKVFRCTICLMINDLKPAIIGSPGENRPVHGSQVRGGTRPGPAPIGKSQQSLKTYPKHRNSYQSLVPPLSVAKTQLIIDHCISSYLEARLNNTDRTPLPSPSPSPLTAEFPGEAKEMLYDAECKPLPSVPKISTAESANVSTPYLSSPFLQPSGSPSGLTPSPSRPSTSTSMYSTSSPGRIPSPFEQMHQKATESIVPQVPVRDPPPPPSRSTSETISGISTGTVEDASYLHMGNSFNVGNGANLRHPRQEQGRSIFKPLENYIMTAFGSCDCIDFSFTTARPGRPARAASEGTGRALMVDGGAEGTFNHDAPMSDLDAKTLLLGDFAENGSWWTGNRVERNHSSNGPHKRDKSVDGSDRDLVSLKTPRVNWAELNDWYQIVLRSGKSWEIKWREMRGKGKSPVESFMEDSDEDGEILQSINDQISEARLHVHRTLLKVTENLLKKPGRLLKKPEDMRFLLILLANPLLYPQDSSSAASKRLASRSRERAVAPIPADQVSKKQISVHSKRSPGSDDRGPGKHSGIVKRILGLLSNLPNECHHYLVAWLSRLSESHFHRIVSLVGSFVTYRLTRQHGRSRSTKLDPTGGLIPSISGPGGGTSAQLHAALGITGPPKKSENKSNPVVYSEDWQIKAASRVMSLLFSANNSGLARKIDPINVAPSEAGLSSTGLAAQQRAHSHGQMLPTSDFYNTLLDYSDLIADFEAWESRRGNFSFCQYPFFLSIWAKIQIMEHDARRQMEVKAREAFFDSIMSRKAVSQYLVLKVRRDCLVEDSLRGVSEVVGSGQEEIKKGIRIEFLGEEGVDAGGLRKEWFLLLVRDVFDPNHGMFVYDDDSHYCYFNPSCFETSDQFFLVGVLLGLAIYNSTILDVPLPPFAFKKLLSSAPSPAGPTPSPSRLIFSYTLEDLAEFRPSLANGLRQLLDFDGDVQETFCRDFVAETERYGQIQQVSLCPDGEQRPVTSANRREFVDLYVRYLLDTAVARQFEPFKRGFYTVCGGNALSLFRPEEIELLVRGSDEPLDVSSLRAVAVYENWGIVNPDETEPTVQWLWEFFGRLNPKDQRKLLGFITGSDRIPAMGATNLCIKISCGGDDCERFPVARTCFNALHIFKYRTREKLEIKLWRAVVESEGFGLK
ncbi:MAG: putative E3 ubiquitin-protein ligase [Pycnora praestabilis]|nr:MAG: putative E3 ubiquitin-protein ligase [Pycnora praestabilis]